MGLFWQGICAFIQVGFEDCSTLNSVEIWGRSGNSICLLPMGVDRRIGGFISRTAIQRKSRNTNSNNLYGNPGQSALPYSCGSPCFPWRAMLARSQGPFMHSKKANDCHHEGQDGADACDKHSKALHFPLSCESRTSC